MENTIFDFAARANNGKDVSFKDFEGKTLLIVNTASKCGFTPQYKGLEELHKEYGPRGLMVIGFPCDQFANQEPGSNTEIAQFCQLNYGVTFPIMGKADVNGKNAHPVFKFLKKHTPGLLGSSVKWNCTKFIVDPDGKTVKRFAPTVEPHMLKRDIEKALSHG